MISRVITGKTQVCGVIGDPIGHTMSPVMHNAAFSKLGIDYVYLPFRVKKDDLGQAIAGARALNLAGLNVTIPHKVAVISFLDELDPIAERIGAVNTIVNKNGTLRGYNTDATGFLQALLDKGFKPEGKKIVVLGAGGASRGISFILAESGANLVILNRPVEIDWAEKLACEISRAFRKETAALELNDKNLAEVLEGSDILVNTTSVGMSPDVDETPVPMRLLRSTPVVFDIVYNPIQTRLLREAQAAGAGTISGLDMLAWQGALAFEKWTGLKAPLELMKREVIKALGK
ncbi:MAG: shikimate dehydrogenase [Dehalococcoidales bacterium]|nr:shikimate dehydrogenase [Dehalococcoidales bacterium]